MFPFPCTPPIFKSPPRKPPPRQRDRSGDPSHTPHQGPRFCRISPAAIGPHPPTRSKCTFLPPSEALFSRCKDHSVRTFVGLSHHQPSLFKFRPPLLISTWALLLTCPPPFCLLPFSSIPSPPRALYSSRSPPPLLKQGNPEKRSRLWRYFFLSMPVLMTPSCSKIKKQFRQTSAFSCVPYVRASPLFSADPNSSIFFFLFIVFFLHRYEYGNLPIFFCNHLLQSFLRSESDGTSVNQLPRGSCMRLFPSPPFKPQLPILSILYRFYWGDALPFFSRVSQKVNNSLPEYGI